MSEAAGNAPAPRLALVGAASLLGKEVKDQLATSGFPGAGVALFDLEDVAGVLTDYGDEARVFADAVTDRVLGHELVCFCGDPSRASAYLEPLLDAHGLGLDCTGAWLDDERAFPWIPGATAPPRLDRQRAMVIPAAPVLLVGSAVAALDELAARAVVNVFLPATERGDAGLEELSQQSTAVLNLLEVEQSVFGRQQAFDLWVSPADHPLCAARVATTLERLELPVPALEVISAPVFHGIALSVFVADTDAATLRRALQESGVNFPLASAARGRAKKSAKKEAADSPARAVGRAGLHAVQVREERRGAWAWLVADNLNARAGAAVAAIHTLLGGDVSAALQ